MPKTKRRSFASAKKPPRKKQRSGYATVARTRGIYAAGEMKYYDCHKAGHAIASGNSWSTAIADPDSPLPAPQTFFAPTQGPGINQRIGKSCNLHKIKVRGHINCPPETNQTAGATPADVRIILFQDNQTNSTQAQGNDVMQNTGVSSILANDAYQNIDNFGRFKVLKDKSFLLEDPNMNAISATDHLTQGLTRRFKFNITFKKPVKVRFNNTNGGTIADIVDHSWHLLAHATSIGGLAPVLNYNVRCCFKE